MKAIVTRSLHERFLLYCTWRLRDLLDDKKHNEFRNFLMCSYEDEGVEVIKSIRERVKEEAPVNELRPEQWDSTGSGQ